MSGDDDKPDLARLRIDKSTPSRSARRSPWPFRLFVVAILVAVWWFYGDRILRFRSGAEPDSKPRPTLARVEAAGALNVAGTSANGYVVARRRAALSTVLSGRLVEIHVEEGSRVAEGEIVARIQYDDYEKQLAEARGQVAVAAARRDEARSEVEVAERALAEERARLVMHERSRDAAETEAGEAERERDRQRRSFEDGILSQSDWDAVSSRARRLRAAAEMRKAELVTGERTVEAAASRCEARRGAVGTLERELERLQAVIEQTEILIEKTYVRAPFAGVIVDKGAEEGEVVAALGAGGNSRGSVATLVDEATLEVQVEIPETRLGRIAPGEGALVFLQSDPTRGWPGRVRQVWPRADRQKGTIEVRIDFLERPPVLREEMGLRVVFTGAGAASAQIDDAGVAVPAAAVLDGTTVQKVVNERIALIDVEVVRIENGRAFLKPTPELRPGDSVLARARPNIAAGTELDAMGADG